MAVQMSPIRVATLSLAVLGCAAEPPGRSAPAEAFARLSPCVESRDAACIYRELDTRSRWSVQTMHRLLGETRAVVERAYPAARRAEALGVWWDASDLSDPEALFAHLCRERRCLDRIAAGFGAVTSTERLGPGAARVTTTRGGEFDLAEHEGEWGLAIFGERLLGDQIHLADKLEQVKKNARAFEERRAALGDPGDAATEKEDPR